MQLEHATIPTYLTALYSIHPGTNSDACQVLRVVAVEEMLHLTLAANILNAVGGKPDLSQPGFVPPFPTYLPNGETDFQVSRERFSKNAVKAFLTIERPANTRDAGFEESDHGLIKRSGSRVSLLPTHRNEEGVELHFYSIGEFYKAIQVGLEYLCDERSESRVFIGDRARQITAEYYYSGGGEIVPVYDLASAKEAIRLISEQGEGYEAEILDFEGEISHYYRFDQLMQGRYYVAGDEAGKPSGEPLEVDWDAVYPVKKNVNLADLPEGSELYAAAVEFNTEYKKFLAKLTEAFGGKPEMLMEAVGTMFHIRDRANELIRNPIPGSNGLHAAPTFEMD
jgi:hypothetical protein